MTQRSLNTRFDAVSVPFADFKAAARSVDATLNDVFVATTLDALRRYHEARGHRARQVRMNMPVSVRGGESANRFDNQFVPTRMVLPLSDADRCHEARGDQGAAAGGDRRAGTAPRQRHLGRDLASRSGRIGVGARRHAQRCRHHHVERSRAVVPRVHGGAKVEEFQAFGPLAGAAINITLFSYDGIVHLGINSDRAAVDHDLFTRCLREAIDATLTLTAPA